MKPKILILVDGGHKAGMGHVFRALNLAKQLKKDGNEIIFITKKFLLKKFIGQKFTCYILSTSNNHNEKLIRRINPNIITIDKLNESLGLLSVFRKIGITTIGIDYTGSNKKLISFGINMLYPNSGIQKNSVSGLKYSILNPSFIRVKPIRIRKKVKSILVLQGGADTRCFIPEILQALNQIDIEFKITTVLGPSFRCWDKIKKARRENKKCLKILHSVKNMSSVMKKHDMAITGGGVSLLELCHLGIPSVVVCGEPFEEETAKLMEKNGFGINIGFQSVPSKNTISYTTNRLLNNYHLRKNMNLKGIKLVDGKGIKRVSQIISRMAKLN